jgi:hypothetical protein
VSKDFDSTLSAAIDLAAAAAQTSGAAAARLRGRKRTVRKRIAVSTLSVVLIATGATVAFKIAAPHTGTPQLTATTPQATATAGPASGSPSSRPTVTADPHQAAPGAWLTAAQLPFGDTVAWKADQAGQNGGPIGQPLTPTVFYMAKDTSLQALTACADPAALLGRTTGAQHAEYAAAQSTTQTASQFVFFFADAASAQQAFNWLQSQYSPACRADSGMTVTKTAGDGQTSAAWLILKGASASLDVSASTRDYFVLRGSTIGYVTISDPDLKLPTAHDDAGQLSTIAAHLCVYGGPCH